MAESAAPRPRIGPAGNDASFPRDVGMIAVPEIRPILCDLAKLMKERDGARVHLYCRTAQDVAYYRANYPGCFASVSFSDFLMRRPAAMPPAEAVLERARAWERKFGTTINRMAVMHRHLGRGYMIGGYHHPRSRITEDWDSVAVYNAYVMQFDFWRREMREKHIELMIGGMPDVVWVYRATGVPYRSLRHARYENRHYWTPDEYGSYPGLEDAFHEVPFEEADIRLSEPYLTERALRSQFKARNRLLPVMTGMASIYLRHAYWRVRGFERARQNFPRQTALHLWRRWTETRRVTNKSIAPLDALADKPFIFFPLQTEPEMTLLQNSPEYFFQYEAILALARALPDGVVLAVKEALHAVGRRPTGFYDQITRLPNVVLLNMDEQGVDVVSAARAVATISSTAGMEALIIGKPAILLGRHNYFDFLPHARKMEHQGQLSALLRWALSNDADLSAARRDGARFLKALKQTSFSLGAYDYLDAATYEPEYLDGAYEALKQSLHGLAEHRMAQMS